MGKGELAERSVVQVSRFSGLDRRALLHAAEGDNGL